MTIKVKNGPRTIYLATHNEHKLAEIKAILGVQCADLRSAKQLGAGISWEEKGESFEENAKIKAIAVSEHTQDCILAEDSGLCVAALGGAPGIYSNRYSGREGDDAANIQKLLAALASYGPDARAAAFVCCLVYIDEQGKMLTFEGRCEGTIAEAPRGTQGFGYDPIFIPRGYTKTMAELDADEKNRISHRRQALEKWAASLIV